MSRLASQRPLNRTVPNMTAEQVVVLRLLVKRANRPVYQWEIERAIAAKGLRISVGPAVEMLEDSNLIGREKPPPATPPRYIATEDGERIYELADEEAYKSRVLRELDARIARAKAPHPRDKTVQPPEAYAYLEHLRKLFLGEVDFLNPTGGLNDAGSTVEVVNEEAPAEDEPSPLDEIPPEDDQPVRAPQPSKKIRERMKPQEPAKGSIPLRPAPPGVLPAPRGKRQAPRKAADIAESSRQTAGTGRKARTSQAPDGAAFS